jgi:hypothetical protein
VRFITIKSLPVPEIRFKSPLTPRQCGLMDTINYQKYEWERVIRYRRSLRKITCRFRPSQHGVWHVIIDLAGKPGEVVSSVKVIRRKPPRNLILPIVCTTARSIRSCVPRPKSKRQARVLHNPHCGRNHPKHPFHLMKGDGSPASLSICRQYLNLTIPFRSVSEVKPNNLQMRAVRGISRSGERCPHDRRARPPVPFGFPSPQATPPLPFHAVAARMERDTPRLDRGHFGIVGLAAFSRTRAGIREVSASASAVPWRFQRYPGDKGLDRPVRIRVEFRRTTIRFRKRVPARRVS